MRATYTRTAGVRHLFAAHELGEDKLFGHIKPRKTRALRRYIIWRNNHAYDERLRQVVTWANIA